MKKQKSKYIVLKKPYVYVVLEHATESQDAIVHDVFTGDSAAFNAALEKKWKLIDKNTHIDSSSKKIIRTHGYIAVLKKPLRGNSVRYIYDEGNEEWSINPFLSLNEE